LKNRIPQKTTGQRSPETNANGRAGNQVLTAILIFEAQLNMRPAAGSDSAQLANQGIMPFEIST